MSAAVDHAVRSHAILPPSACARWSVCTPSARLEEQLPYTTSDAAEEGTLAHEICEVKLRGYFDAAHMTKRQQTTALNKLKKDERYQQEMDGYTDGYLDYVKGLYMSLASPVISIEQSLDISKWVPECNGTADCVLISGDTLVIVDFKYGKGVRVDAEDNPQLKLYALGALARFDMIYDIEKVKLCIYQPRIDHNSEWDTTYNDLLEWGTWISARAEIAFKGEGDFVPGEAQCRFCRAKAQCRARAQQNVQLAFGDPVHTETPDRPAIQRAPALIAPEEIGRYLEIAQDVEQWAKDLEAYALSQCLAGVDVPGWKAVEGRANRAWTDQAEAFEALIRGGVPDAILYEKKPLTLAGVEKAIGKQRFSDLAGKFVTTPPGKPALVKSSDKRPAITNKVTAEEAFANSEDLI